MSFEVPLWPFVVRLAGILLGIVVLARSAWTHTSRSRTASRAVVRVLAWCAAAAAVWMGSGYVYEVAGTFKLSLPGGSWEDVPPETTAWLGVWMTSGAAFGALLLGLPLASAVAMASSLRVLWRGWRRGAEPTTHTGRG